MKLANLSGVAAARAGVDATHAGKSRAKGPRLPEASREAKRVAAALLEVLAGAATPAAAAGTLGVSLPRFYVLEARAMQAFVAACEPRAGGRTIAPAREMDLLRQQVERLQRECTRHQTLLRLAQRSIGLVPPAPHTGKNKQSGNTKRKRRPVARALVAARSLRAGDDTPEVPADPSGHGNGESITTNESQGPASDV